MKKVYSTLLIFSALCLVFLQSQAQMAVIPQNSKLAHFGNRIVQPSHSLLVTDTLYPPSSTLPCFDTITYYYYSNNPDTGYLSGNLAVVATDGVTWFHSLECAQRYSFTGTGTISDVLVWYGYATGTNGVTSVKIYNVSSTTGLPSTLKGVSQTVTTGVIGVSIPQPVDYTFSTPVNITTKFFASCVLPNPANGDTTVIYGTQETCNSGDSASAFKLDAGIGFYYYKKFISFKDVGDTSIDLLITPIVDVATDINNPPTTNGLSLLGAYPNPASAYTNVKYKTDRATEANIKVFDIHGKTYRTISESVGAGDHQFNLDLKDMAAGNYFYTIKIADATISSKFTVVK